MITLPYIVLGLIALALCILIPVGFGLLIAQGYLLYKHPASLYEERIPSRTDLTIDPGLTAFDECRDVLILKAKPIYRTRDRINVYVALEVSDQTCRRFPVYRNKAEDLIVSSPYLIVKFATEGAEYSKIKSIDPKLEIVDILPHREFKVWSDQDTEVMADILEKNPLIRSVKTVVYCRASTPGYPV